MKIFMRFLLCVLIIALSTIELTAGGRRSSSSSKKSSSSSHSVRSHVTKRGTYVQSHRSTNPDKKKWNNYSTKGNYNPYTGKKGTKSPYKK